MIYSVKVKIQNYNKNDKKKWYLNEVGIYDEIIDYSKNRIFLKINNLLLKGIILVTNLYLQIIY